MSEFQQISTGFVPRNDNPRIWVAQSRHIKGGGKQFDTLEDFLNLHPDLMNQDMPATISQHQRSNGIFRKTMLVLSNVPPVSAWPLSGDPDAENYYLKFWTVDKAFDLQTIDTVYQYSPDINGARPPFPYIQNPAFESFWKDENDASEDFKWMRFRNTDRQDTDSGIYLDWSVPVPISGQFEQGDFIQVLFIRSATKPVLPSAVDSDGLPNNFPTGWSGTIPEGTANLWEIRGQKDVYGILKGFWIGPFLIPEDEDLVRFSERSTPNPNTLVGTNTSAEDDSAADILLEENGWEKSYDPTKHLYRAKRSLIEAGVYTTWKILKIEEESGEYVDIIYKLFPRYLDYTNPNNDFILANTPSGNDPVLNPENLARNEGWAGEQHQETDLLINFESRGVKFFNGELKGSWSAPRPSTGQDVYADAILTDGQNSFRRTSSDDATPDPASITMEFVLKLGVTEVTTNLTYKWFKIYDNRDVIVVNPDVDTPLSELKTLVVTPADVNGKAIFRCYAYLDINGLDQPVLFVEEQAITDITDGDNARSLQIATETPLLIYDAAETEFSVERIFIRSQQSFLNDVPFYWFKYNFGTSEWDEIENNDEGLNSKTYAVSKQSLAIDTDGLFAANQNREIVRFLCSTNQNDPEDDDAYWDAVTITKVAGTGVGAPGEAYTALLSDEVDVVILNEGTFNPISGEIGEVGTANTILQVYENSEKLTRVTDYSISLSSSDSDVTFASANSGTDDYKIYISAWTGSQSLRKVKCTITITIDGLVFTKIWTVTTNLDDAGAVIADIDVASDSTNKTFAFRAGNRGQIKLEAKLYQNGNLIPASSWAANGASWSIDGVTSNSSGTSGTNRQFKAINRSDVAFAIRVQVAITFGGKTYTSSPQTIDDLSDARRYIAYYQYAAAFDVDANEPLVRPTTPALPARLNDFNALSNTGAAQGWYKQSQNKSYWKAEGIEDPTDNTSNPLMIWTPADRFRGERGVQGPTGATGLQGPAGQTGSQGSAGPTGPTGAPGEGIKTFYTGSSGGTSNTFKRIASVPTPVGTANLRRHLQLSVGARSSRSQGILSLNFDTNTSGLNNLTTRYVETSPVVAGSPSEYYYRLIGGVLEVWVKTTNTFTDAWFSVLHNYVSGSLEWTFYENNNSLTTVQPTGLVEVPRIRLADIAVNTDAITNINTDVTNVNTEISTLKLINERPRGINTIRVNSTSGSSAQVQIGYRNVNAIGTFSSGSWTFTVDPYGAASFTVSGVPQILFVRHSSGIFVCDQTGGGMNKGDIYSVTAVGGTEVTPTFTLTRIYASDVITLIEESNTAISSSTLNSIQLTRKFYRTGKMATAWLTINRFGSFPTTTFSSIIPAQYRPVIVSPEASTTSPITTSVYAQLDNNARPILITIELFGNGNIRLSSSFSAFNHSFSRRICITYPVLT